MTPQTIPGHLSPNPYPGRGILLGRSPDGARAVLVYFIMGRSENSRNRIFSKTEDGIRTEACDPAKLTDPSLIIYHPVRLYEGKTIVTNGDQTDTIWQGFQQGQCYRHALMTREFEPDAPNYTPRISGVLLPDGSYKLSILKSLEGNPSCCCRYFYEYDAPVAGTGHLIHTYQRDGSPLPSFQGEPVLVEVPAGDARTLAELVWNSLDAGNRVSLYARSVRVADGSFEDIIINQYEKKE